MDSRPCWGHLCSPLQVSLRSPRCSDYGISPTIRSPGFRSAQPTPDGGLRTLCPAAAPAPSPGARRQQTPMEGLWSGSNGATHPEASALRPGRARMHKCPPPAPRFHSLRPSPSAGHELLMETAAGGGPAPPLCPAPCTQGPETAQLAGAGRSPQDGSEAVGPPSSCDNCLRHSHGLPPGLFLSLLFVFLAAPRLGPRSWFLHLVEKLKYFQPPADRSTISGCRT